MGIQNENAVATNTAAEKISSPRRVRGRRGVPVNTSSNTPMDMDVTKHQYGEVAATSNVPTSQKVKTFMNRTQQAMETLMREHGFSVQRAQRTLLDHLVTFPGVDARSPILDVEVLSIVNHCFEYFLVCCTNSTLSKISQVFDCMRLHDIGMEQATIALTIEKAIVSFIHTQKADAASINTILDGWTESLKRIKPMPLREPTVCPEPSAIVLPVMQSTLSVAGSQSKKISQSSTPPIPPAPATPATVQKVAADKAMASSSRSKLGKKSSKLAASTPPTTITTTTQRPRSDPVFDAVSSKLTAVDNEASLKGKPPLAPGTSILGAASSVSASTKRSIGDGLLERPSTPPSSTSSKRQRRSSGAN